ncbi:MAG TPA: BCD family MFS transporter [Sphingorhabdus lacus]|jgi:BCD family chlorophyll transporter-like MFS transporter|nr:BCD family MFS transporter [Sphingorhabdus lacus]HPV69207.1 BCD family MFS transporter [Sphingorhabdus lacus]
MTPYAAGTGIGWFGVVRLGTVQAAIGAMVMLATSLLNRVMVVEFAIAAAVPAGLVAWHYAVQLSRPLWGHKSDRSEKRSSWIMAGMGILALGTLIAVDATIMMAGAGIFAIILAVLGFSLIGLGVGMAGTALLALLASRVAVERKPAAAAISWTMMVAGIVVAAGVSGSFLDPFSDARLAIVTSMVVLVAFCVAMLALRGLERNSLPVENGRNSNIEANFTQVLRDISQDQQARRFTYFVFISMLAYSMQDLILEPFAGFIFGMTPGESTQLAGVQHSGILLGMLVAGLGGSLYAKYFGRNEKLWIIIGCLSSAVMLGALSIAAAVGPAWPLKANVFGLGVANGIFAVAAVGAMLGLASDGSASGEGARMGVWGAAQAIAFGAGGLLGAVIVDLLRGTMADDSNAFQIVFVVEGAMFILAALVATGTSMARRELNGKAVQI